MQRYYLLPLARVILITFSMTNDLMVKMIMTISTKPQEILDADGLRNGFVSEALAEGTPDKRKRTTTKDSKPAGEGEEEEEEEEEGNSQKEEQSVRGNHSSFHQNAEINQICQETERAFIESSSY
jgi:hypothetical protein